MSITRLQKGLEKAVTRRDELAGDRAAVQEQLSTKRDEMANTVYERGSPDKLLRELEKLREKDRALSAALAKAEVVISELSDNLATAQKEQALKELDRLNAIGKKHIIGFFAGLYQSQREGELAKDFYKEVIRIQNQNNLGADTCQLRDMISWVDYDEGRTGIALKRFDQNRPEWSKAAQQ